MSELIVLLVLLWAVVLIPGALRSRTGSPQKTVGGFSRAMDVLKTKPAGRELLVPGDAVRLVDDREVVADAVPRRAAAREDLMTRRRRAWFVRLLAGTGATLLLAIVLGGWGWLAFLVAAAATVGYAAMLRRLKLQRDAARAKVREIDVRDAADLPERQVEREPAAVGAGVRLRRWED